MQVNDFDERETIGEEDVTMKVGATELAAHRRWANRLRDWSNEEEGDIANLEAIVPVQ